MGMHFQHSGGTLPVTLHLDETEIERPCPTCVRAEYDGVVTVTAAAERKSGTTPTTCSRGHLVMVEWTREEEPAAE